MLAVASRDRAATSADSARGEDIVGVAMMERYQREGIEVLRTLAKRCGKLQPMDDEEKSANALAAFGSLAGLPEPFTCWISMLN